jgi:hypothetical protein
MDLKYPEVHNGGNVQQSSSLSGCYRITAPQQTNLLLTASPERVTGGLASARSRGSLPIQFMIGL